MTELGKKQKIKFKNTKGSKMSNSSLDRSKEPSIEHLKVPKHNLEYSHKL